MTRVPVSTIIPVYNGASFLADALASIGAQRPPPEEIVVVDDGSTDGSAEVAAARGVGVRIVTHPRNLGLASALNTGIREANGELVTFLDADDLWSPDKMRVQLAVAGRDPSADIVVGNTQKLRLLGGSGPDLRFEPWAGPELALSLGASLIRREAFERVGDFDTSLRFSCDWDWFMRAREMGIAIKIHPEVVQYYRRHGSNMTEAVEEGNHYTLQMLQQSLLRRRQGPTGVAESLPQLDED